MRTASLLVGVGLLALGASALAHTSNPTNQRNRRHPAVRDATTGNFRRGAVLELMGVPRAGSWRDGQASVRPLARALGQAHSNRKTMLDKVRSYQTKRGEVIQMVHVWSTGKVSFVAAPKDRAKPCRVMGRKELRALGITPQNKVIPALVARLNGSEGKVGKQVKPAGLSYSGLSYQAVGNRKLKKWPANSRNTEGYVPILRSYATVPITATKHNLGGSSLSQWTSRERVGQ